jgi:outer membrane protein assembly factor BamE (lipoprotein component of BamABCDE complex)
MKTLRIIITGGLLAIVVQAAQGQTVTREEFNALAERLAVVEAALIEARAGQVESIAEEALATVQMSATQKSTLIENVVKTIQVREEEKFFPWMDSVKWDSLQKGMKPAAVVAVLGEPTLDEPSLHKRIDTVYTYKGRRVATGEKVTGIIRFYKGVVVSIEVPEL